MPDEPRNDIEDDPANLPRSDARFNALLLEWSDADPSARISIERRLFDEFQSDVAILVLDMSGFSSSVVKHGITHFLAKIARMRRVTGAVIEEFGGELVKYIADDVLAVFPSVERAYDAAYRMMSVVEAANAHAEPDMVIHIAIGIGYGPTLHVPGVDVWGDQANRAFKLGEDTAESGEILLTEEAAAALRAAPEPAASNPVGADRIDSERAGPDPASSYRVQSDRTLEPWDVSISGVEIKAFRGPRFALSRSTHAR